MTTLALFAAILVLGFLAVLGLMWYAHSYIAHMNETSLWLDRCRDYDLEVFGSQAKSGTLDQAI